MFPSIDLFCSHIIVFSDLNKNMKKILRKSVTKGGSESFYILERHR